MEVVNPTLNLICGRVVGRRNEEGKVSDLSYKLERDIQETIRKHIADAKGKVIQQANDEFARRVREIVGNIAISLANMYSVERLGHELVIRVKIEGGRP